MKRKRKSRDTETNKKRIIEEIKHPVLCHYYNRITTLRQHVLSKLPAGSKQAQMLSGKIWNHDKLETLLDTTLICRERDSYQICNEDLHSQLSGSESQSDVIDFAIWMLFNKVYPNFYKPPHILCHGIQRAAATWQNGQNMSIASRIPGLVSILPNDHVETLKTMTWQELFDILGKYGHEIMLDLILETAIFLPVSIQANNFYQLSGIPMHTEAETKTVTVLTARNPSDIRFVRHRMFYAKPNLNARNEISFGLGHIHVLNRSSDSIIKYIFPRQFKLHNVFTSNTDSQDTIQPFKDYTIREIQKSNVPKRLRGEASILVQKLSKLHRHCSYSMLLEYYCPRTPNHTIPQLATSSTNVSAFCRAVVKRVFPKAFFGNGQIGKYNLKIILRNIDLFIKARRFESLTLEKVIQGLKIHGISWAKPLTINESQKMSISDVKKRRELINELIYYIFDSFIIPLVRTNFHVTESNMDKNQLFYFRHDVWRKLTEPALISLKSTFKELEPKEAIKILANRTLSYSQVRLLPKTDSMRPIANLRRRLQIKKDGKRILCQSINSILAPVSTILNYEKRNQPQCLGSSLFSVSDIYSKIKTFRMHAVKPFYFVKVDVKSCFDSLPQTKVLELVQGLFSNQEYSIARHTEIRQSFGTIIKRYCKTGTILGEYENFIHLLQDTNQGRNMIYINDALPKSIPKQFLMELLKDHIQCNIVKLEKKFHHQRQGIPQGSVLSSLLCNLLYARFEQENLSFLSTESLLLRLIDDFLLITTSHTEAIRFLEVMSRGNSDYGITITPSKSLTNFPNQIQPVPEIKGTMFPYCGLEINTLTLDIHKTFTNTRITNSLTVEYSRNPGQSLCRKMLNSVKLQMLGMFFDTAYNARSTVITNLYRVYLDTAQKCQSYIKCLGSCKPKSHMIINLIKDIIKLSYSLLKRRCIDEPSISKSTAQRLACNAFLQTFQGKTQYVELNTWLNNVKKCQSLDF